MEPSFEPRVESACHLAGDTVTRSISPALASGRPCLRLVSWEAVCAQPGARTVPGGPGALCFLKSNRVSPSRNIPQS